ncbi:long chain base biosynthesis protein 1-like isoform X2 [Silene latifolia]|uniref:long chain base biosynthesis protein 1-like isoform X2 n=1 Tax=Silene latifolia TaxID=37657 RepID=UPI003D77646C
MLLVLVNGDVSREIDVAREIDSMIWLNLYELCDEWTPESLVPALMEYTDRAPQVLQSSAGPHTVINGKSAVNFASANYLGLLGHEKLLDSCISTVEKYGVGSCGPRGFYGNVDVHLDCEARIARFMGTSDSILYSYGLATMFSVLPFHCSRTNIIVVDEGVHWGIQNGLLLTRKKTIVYFKHNDMTSLENVLIDNILKHKRAKKCFIVIEAVYQNSGQIAPLDEIVRLKDKYKCRLMMDESNSFGVLGHSGRGLTEYYGIPIGKIDVLTATLGHAMASEGGFCTGSFCDNSGFVQDHRLDSKGYVYSASLPPYLACAAMSALVVLEEHPNLIQQLNENITFLRAGLSIMQGLEVVSSPDSPIVFLKLTQSTGATETDNQLLQDIADQVLKEHGVYVSVSKRSPIDTCPLPIGIRLCVSAGHSKSDLTKLCHSLKTVCRSSINKS